MRIHKNGITSKPKHTNSYFHRTMYVKNILARENLHELSWIANALMVFHQSEFVQDPYPKQYHGDIVNPTSTSITRGGASICREPNPYQWVCWFTKTDGFSTGSQSTYEKISLDFNISIQISQGSQPCGICICLAEAIYLITLQISAWAGSGRGQLRPMESKANYLIYTKWLFG